MPKGWEYGLACNGARDLPPHPPPPAGGGRGTTLYISPHVNPKEEVSGHPKPKQRGQVARSSGFGWGFHACVGGLPASHTDVKTATQTLRARSENPWTSLSRGAKFVRVDFRVRIFLESFCGCDFWFFC